MDAVGAPMNALRIGTVYVAAMSLTNIRAAVASFAAAQLLACGTESDHVIPDRAVEGELSYVRSESSAGTDADEAPMLLSHGIFTPFPDCRVRHPPCAQASVTYSLVTVRFDRPAGPGTFALADLAAIACEHATADEPSRCSPIAGSLEVTTVTAPCGEDPCGRFAGVLSIDAPSVVHGTVTLRYSERIVTVESSGCNGQGG
jgi:hypothetical protein